MLLPMDIDDAIAVEILLRVASGESALRAMGSSQNSSFGRERARFGARSCSVSMKAYSAAFTAPVCQLSQSFSSGEPT